METISVDNYAHSSSLSLSVSLLISLGLQGLESRDWRARTGEQGLESKDWRARTGEQGLESVDQRATEIVTL